MVRISDTPIFFTFFKRFLAFTGELEFAFDMENEFFLQGYCKCEQKDCATVYLKRTKNWKKKNLGSYLYNTNRGMVIVHLLDDGALEFEALEYEFPYKREVEYAFAGTFKAASAVELKALDDYFDGLERMEISRIKVDE